MKYLADSSELTSIADAIRTKGGTSAGLTYPDGFVSAINAIPTGGGGVPDGDVIFIDYDGTIVDAKTKAQINAMTSDSDLPANPTHTGLTAQGWNWTVAQLKAQLTAMPAQKIYVGQMYTTTSGATEIDVEMYDGRLNPTLTICVNGTISVDWGDNTTPDSVTGTSSSTRIAVPHTYASEGNYTIKISKTSGTGYTFYGSSSYFILRKSTTSNQNRVYASCIRAIRIGNNASFSSGAFYYCGKMKSITIPNSVTSINSNLFNGCYSLASVTIPSNITSIGDGAFNNCYSLVSISIPSTVTSISFQVFYNNFSLKNITLPNGVTSVGNSTFYYCAGLENIEIPSGITSFGTNVFQYCNSISSITIPNTVISISNGMFYYCYSIADITISSEVTSIGESAFYGCMCIQNITIPNKVTSIGNSAFCSCYSIVEITIPSNVTSIGNNSFSNCYGVAKYHIKPTTPPTLGTTPFASIPSDCVIYVPQGKLSDYQTATGWSDYASYMQEEPS